jgi:homoserine dehydrogenase
MQPIVIRPVDDEQHPYEIMQQSRLKDLIPIVILTDPVLESKMDEALAQIQALPTIHGEIIRIRLESLDS